MKTIKSNDGNRYAILTAEEAKHENMPLEPMEFKTIEEAQAFVKQLMETPEGEQEMNRILKNIYAQSLN